MGQPGAWNIVATAKPLQLGPLVSLLRRFGRFRHAPFRGVLLGEVEDRELFLDNLRRLQEYRPEALDPLARLVPVDRTFPLDLDALLESLQVAVLPYADLIGDGRYYVRVERRGHRDAIHRQDIEQALDYFLAEILRARGCDPSIDFGQPDVVVVVEIVGETCGVGVIPRALHERLPFVRVH